MKILITIGSIHIPFFGVMIAIGMISALFLIRYEAKRRSMNVEKITDLTFWGILGGVLGGRLGYILFYGFSQYLENPLEIFKIYNGGLSIHGGILGGTIGVLLYIKKNKELHVLDIGDLVTPALILGQGIGRVGCDVYGKVMSIPRFWGVPVNGLIYHPAQVYEFVLNYILFMVLWYKRDRMKYRGQLFGVYLIGFAINRSLVEIFRVNPQVLGFLSVSHILSIILIVLGILWLKLMKYKNFPLEYKNSYPTSLKSILLKGFVLIIVSIIVYYFVQLNF